MVIIVYAKEKAYMYKYVNSILTSKKKYNKNTDLRNSEKKFLSKWSHKNALNHSTRTTKRIRIFLHHIHTIPYMFATSFTIYSMRIAVIGTISTYHTIRIFRCVWCCMVLTFLSKSKHISFNLMALVYCYQKRA